MSLTVISLASTFADELANTILDLLLLRAFQEKLVDVLKTDHLLLLSSRLALCIKRTAEVQQSWELLR